MKIPKKKIREIEEFVNSPELEAIAEASSWEDIWNFILRWNVQSSYLLHTEDLERLERDLHDWWKNGNMRHWEEDEVNDFGMRSWELGDPDFWS